MIFDEDFDSDFHWKLTTESENVLKISADEKMPADEASPEIGKHQWVFEGNETGTAVLKFEYIHSQTGYVPEKYTYTVKNTENELEISSFTSLSENLGVTSPYTERISISKDKEFVSFNGQCISSMKTGDTHWYLEKIQTDVLTTISQEEPHTTINPCPGLHSWKFEGQTSGNVTLTMNYENSEIGLLSEIVYGIHVNENKDVSIRNMSYNSVKSKPVPIAGMPD
jgi:predicted secreted protein